ncbi:transcriptional regulator [Streptomyces chrestomyceticus JCM 4735]|uniref:Transcriptional regulator n=1 Tax=Streptomyces chrestomyceticus JCM 4735 TaxID=1306181 RepID=A0A7U9L2P0_9ACTN|nr:transcriptional regulator [Streptomyces chrestomyceticus]GCD39317.1 transcriptional regulator [Streptomyces chrestomyceticus JCM 4735]
MTEGSARAGTGGSHPRHALVPLLNSPVRLSVVAALSPVDRAGFAVVRDLVEVTDSALSKQVAALEAAGWLAVSKGRAGRRPLTWLALTAEGRAVYQRHLAALRAIAGGGGVRHVPEPGGAVPDGDAVLNGVVSPSCHDDGHEHT